MSRPKRALGIKRIVVPASAVIDSGTRQAVLLAKGEGRFEDFETAVATYWAACQRWPRAKITLRAGARVVKRNWWE